MAKVISRLIIGHKDIIVLTIWVVVKLNCGLMVYCFSDDIGHNYTFSWGYIWPTVRSKIIEAIYSPKVKVYKKESWYFSYNSFLAITEGGITVFSIRLIIRITEDF